MSGTSNIDHSATPFEKSPFRIISLPAGTATVSFALLLVADPIGFVARARKRSPLRIADALATFSVDVVVPVYGATSLSALHVVPLLLETSQRKVGAGLPLVVTLNARLWPALTF